MKHITFLSLIILSSCIMHLPTEPELYVNDKYPIQLSDSAKSLMNGVYAVDTVKIFWVRKLLGFGKIESGASMQNTMFCFPNVPEDQWEI